MFRVFVVKDVAYVSEESDVAFRKLHNLRSQDCELIASYTTREALTSKQFERALKQYRVTSVVDETTPPPEPTKPFGVHSLPPEERKKAHLKTAATLRGNKMSEETRAKMSAAKRGKRSNNKGKRRPIIANIQQAMARKGIQTTLNYLWWHDPWSGDEVRLPPDAKPPQGFFPGRSPDSMYDMKLAGNYKKKRY